MEGIEIHLAPTNIFTTNKVKSIGIAWENLQVIENTKGVSFVCIFIYSAKMKSMRA